MVPHGHELEIVAHGAEILLAGSDPGELAQRLLDHAARHLEADAGLLVLARAGVPPVRAALRLEPAAAELLAREAATALRAAPRIAGGRPALAPALRPLGLRAALAARIHGPDSDGVLAFFWIRPGCMDPRRHARWVRLLARCAAAGLAGAAARADARRAAPAPARRPRAGEADGPGAVTAADDDSRLAGRIRFLTTMSHELRTPINALLGYNELLRQGLFGRLTRRQAEVVRKMASNAEHLSRLVDNILDIARLDADGLDVRRVPVRVRPLLVEARDAVEPDARRKGLRLQVRCPRRLPDLDTDPDRVRQILLNLLANAVKFTERGSIRIEARHIDRDGACPAGCEPGERGWVAIAVRDTGTGIPHELQDRIFDEFVQIAEPAGTNPRGTGLGLPISRRLASLLGGALRVDSEPGVSSTFTLYLPCPAPPGPARAAPPSRIG